MAESKLPGLFITGTDTNVGKTVVAAAMMHRCRALKNLRYWKPIQTGIEQDDDTATVQILGSCSDDELLVSGIRLQTPVAPYLAAERSNTRISVRDVVRCIPADAGSRLWIVEGAGGLLVPINASEFMIDLVAHLGMPALLVARSTLGTINHTLLSLEALRARALEIAGVVMVGDPNPENRKAIERWGGVRVLGEMPLFPALSATALRDWALSQLDFAQHLSVWLQ